MELTNTLDMDKSDYQAPFAITAVCELVPSPMLYRHAVINSFVQVHNAVRKVLICKIFMEDKIELKYQNFRFLDEFMKRLIFGFS